MPVIWPSLKKIFIFVCAGCLLYIGLSLVVASRGQSLVMMCGLLIMVASCVVEHGLQGVGFSGCGAWAQLPCGMWNLPGLGIEPLSLAQAGRFLTTCMHVCVCARVCTCLLSCSVAQLCLTLYDSMDCSSSGSSAHGIFQARILKQVAIFYSRA